MSLFLLRPAVFLLATICARPAKAEAVANDGVVFGPDSNGVCYEGSPDGPAIPCPTQVYGHLPKTAIAGIAVAVLFVIALLVALLLWRRQVRATTDDSASSLFDFVPPAKRGRSRAGSHRPSSPHLSVQTMVASKCGNEKDSYFCHGSELNAEGGIADETLT
ncbi:hypothetical protein BDP27DRAFT_272822 [Rhodocollybia butyracea]|uniref:Uncharacterized protein n=1 Tax=Rhodocollybia butyracea TaxID=206335 RepID=A0A9P5U1V8_9AGAR|nr:hypothetical protein BDP27DRAFT_272822 [Rhodocollybia butyracea]